MPKRTVRHIESADNARFKNLKKIVGSKGARKYQATLVGGAKIVEDVVARRPDLCAAWIGTEEMPAPPDALPARAEWLVLSRRLFRTLDVSGTAGPLLLADVPTIETWRPEDGLPPGCSVMVPFQDPENVGAVVRSAVAFAAATVILLEGCGHPFHPRAVRASAGAVFAATFRTGPALEDLPDDLPVLALSSEGADIADAAFPDPCVLLPGVEGPGLPGRFRNRALAIPTSGAVESLNAATATAIALYVHFRARRRPDR